MKKLHAILCGATLCASLFMTPKNFANILDTNIEKEINEFEQFKEPETSIKILETEKNIEISIALPEFKKEELTVTIEDKTEKEPSKKRLVITAKKTAPEKDKETEKEESDKKKEVQIKTFQQFSSFKSINGQEQSIQFKNGQLEISLDLPKDAATEDNYEMQFKDNKLIITFLKIEKKHKKHLSFTK